MATEVIMPQMGESIFEGTITKWLKSVGDKVEKDEPLFEISTDKVDAEIPSPVAGTLTEIKVTEGTTVQINTVVALVGAAGESAAAPAPQADAPKAEAPKADAKAPATAPVGKSTAGDGATAEATDKAVTKAATDASVETGSGPVTGGTEVVMPQMGESIFEGTITKWLKKVGDSVAKDEPLFEISTDKVDAEIPAPIAGKLSEIKVPEGTTVQINTVVAVIGGSASAAAAVPAPISFAAVAPESAPAPVAAVAPGSTPASGTTDRLRSSPLVRRIAKDNNLDLR